MADRQDRARNAKRDRGRRGELPIEDLYAAPSEVTEDEYPVALMCGCRIVQRLQFARGTLVFFAIMWIKRDGFGKWEEQHSVDTGHGYFHEHTHGHRRANDRRNVKPLYSQLDVQECFDDGYDLVQNRHDRECRGVW